MQLTPSQSFEHITESVIQYLETAYKISHPLIFEERSSLLRQPGIIARYPFIESTPAFPASRRLQELEATYPEFIPTGLSDLVKHGISVDRFPLYLHQEISLLAARKDQKSLIVATGTGSGKTESFLLPIMADLINEAVNWEPTAGHTGRGRFDENSQNWLHSRQHEKRPAALRAIILYPMNALVNDQLGRLRRILASSSSQAWQHAHLKGNQLYFGMYTSLAQPTGSWKTPGKRKQFEEYYRELEQDWEKLPSALRETGSWPRPNSPEMLCRWDIQEAPPDILVTNYSMLEYMLVRPIETDIFERTRHWLETSPGAHLTLVLDEAHTYSGAKGTEVAYLVRRLKERLGLDSGSGKFRAIATTASVPSGDDQKILKFASDLFCEPTERFKLVRTEPTQTKLLERHATSRALKEFATFYENFDLQNPVAAIHNLASGLNLVLPPSYDQLPPSVLLHYILQQNNEIEWVRWRTARNATQLDILAEECWSGLGSLEARDKATAGILAAGSFARHSDSADIAPMLSMRIHAFTRGLPGLWGCLNQQCPEVSAELSLPDYPRPVGKLYPEPRIWCSPRCGSRVLELFSCRKCGLLFMGGIPEEQEGSLWPWSDDLDGEKQDLKRYKIFGLEAPAVEVTPTYRSIRTTLESHPKDIYSRPVYEIAPDTKSDSKSTSPFPQRCPRCQNSRSPGQSPREIIEPFRTRTSRAFSVMADASFRVQMPSTSGDKPNYGRKALLFSDSRMEAAQLAADLRNDHHADLFRQMLYRAIYCCVECDGHGEIEEEDSFVIGQTISRQKVKCQSCGGSGLNIPTGGTPQPLGFTDLRRKVIDLQIAVGINPTNGREKRFFQLYQDNNPDWSNFAEEAFNAGLRRELSEDEFALEPMGLARWRVKLPATSFGRFDPLTEEESRLLIQLVSRILASEDILLPPQPLKPWEWNSELVEKYERRVLIRARAIVESDLQTGVPYNFNPYRKLGRYIKALASKLVRDGRLANADKWLGVMESQLWDALTNKTLNILVPAGSAIREQTPRGIRLDMFELHPVNNLIEECQSCALLMGDTVASVCLRCGQETKPIEVTKLRKNFFRQAAYYALPGSGFHDPYPLRSIEHSAQISGKETRNYERWFQDMFQENQQPLDSRIDILSVTTTMEMGIDIGSLLSVALSNVPPSVANYQQRAGRAGRRGSALATVMTSALLRSHDQYYFDRPPEIVSGTPRVPVLYLNNEVIVHRHVRSVLLQSFFFQKYKFATSSNLLQAWGLVEEYTSQKTAVKLADFLEANSGHLIERCTHIVPANFQSRLSDWLNALRMEIDKVVAGCDDQIGLLEALINGGLLPKYAFPVDVVRLNIPTPRDENNPERFESAEGEGMQRDLKIALAEYVPGAEVLRGDFPNTYVYQSAGLYDPFNDTPDYHAHGQLVECSDCQSVQLIGQDETSPDECAQCNGLNLITLPYLRPPGFTVDWAKPDAGRELYKGGGRERSGTVLPARLLIGETVFNSGHAFSPVAPSLFIQTRNDNLFCCNKGPDQRWPGFRICASCGRYFSGNEKPGKHRYPANIPPNRGYLKGPRAGAFCVNTTDLQNQVVLGYPFRSDLILMGVNLPPELDAPINQPFGRAIWYSFGTLLVNAASLILQVDAGELKVGVRAINRGPGRLHGEVFIYDDVPGGAGYANAIADNLEEILFKALKLGRNCTNPQCIGACYHCVLDYRNQLLHPILDRELGTALLEYILSGKCPQPDPIKIGTYVAGLEQYTRLNSEMKPGRKVEGLELAAIFQKKGGSQVGLHVIHPLESAPGKSLLRNIFIQHKIKCVTHTLFDLERRPFWVSRNI